MEIVDTGPFTAAPVPGRLEFPAHSLTLVVKGTFDLVADGPCTAVEEPLYPTGDEPYEDDDEGTGSLRYASDFAPFKPRADLLLVGRAYVPDGKAARRIRASFRVGDRERTVVVCGDRARERDEPEPFQSMELRWENAFGGPKHKVNPAGRGHRGSGDALPNLEDPADSAQPCCFAPIAPTWKTRAGKLGTYKKKWLQQRWPWFPEDLDWTHFNAAPDPQQRDGYLRGDEPLTLVHLHPEAAEFRSHLPGLRPRAFVETDEEEFREVELVLDTLWIDTEAARLVLLWRGATPVSSEEYPELRRLLVVSEPLADEPAPAEHYRPLLDEPEETVEAEMAPEPEPPAEKPPAAADVEAEAAVDKELAELEQQVAAEVAAVGALPVLSEAEQLAQLKKAGIEVPEEEEPEEAAPGEAEEPAWSRERVEGHAATGGSFTGIDLRGLDLSGLALEGANFTDALLAGSSFAGAGLAGAILAGANAAGADFSRAGLAGAQCADADFASARFAGADLNEANLTDAFAEEADFTDARLDRLQASGAQFAGADLSRAALREANLEAADLDGATLVEANLEGASLKECSLGGARCAGARFAKTDVTGLRASDGADLTGASFEQAGGEAPVFEGSRLDEANFSFARMSGATFDGASLAGANCHAAGFREARFRKANLRGARLTHADLFRALLEKADLDEADLSGANCYEAEFLAARTQGTRLDGTNVKMTKLA